MRSRPAIDRWRTYMLLSVLLILSLRASTVLADGPKFPPLTGRVVDGEFITQWDYSKHLHRRATVEAIANDVIHVLQALIAQT